MPPDRPWAALLVLAGGLLLWPAAPAAGALRWAALRPRGAEGAGPRGTDGPGPRGADGPGRAPERDAGRERTRRWLLAGSAAAPVLLLLGGWPGAVAGGALAVAVERFLRTRAPDAGAGEAAARARELPGACDLLAVCVAAGLPVEGALDAVGAAVGGPLGAELRAVAAVSRLGADPRRAWADAPADLAPLARVLVRAGESGATVAGALRTLAAERRAAARAATAAAVQRAGVWVLAPLGACFLPAFLCLGVAPLVLGIAGDVLP